MNKTVIEWCGYTINPVKGMCPMACDYCYARRMYKRFKWNTEIRFDQHVWRKSIHRIAILPKPSRIFIGSTFELFGDWCDPDWISQILEEIAMYKSHTFIFLTKKPENLIKWSPFPENCWIGVSVCNDKMLDVAVDKLEDIPSDHKFISFEPLLERLTLSLDYAMYYSGISWVIIGQRTPVSIKTQPKIEWIREIVLAADKAGIPVFLKDNLKSLLPATYPFVTNPLRDADFYLRQEFPK